MRSLAIFLALLGVGAVSQSAEASTASPWLGSVDQAVSEARRTEKLILVDLYAEWCGWCKRLEQDVFSTATFHEFAEDYVLLRVDTEDGGEGTRLQEKYEAYSLPTTLVIDKDGVMIASIPGYSPAPRYIASIETKVAAFDELVEGFERYGQSSDPRILGILADEFHQRSDGTRAATLYRRLLTTGGLPPAKLNLIRYQLADALRLARQYDEAWEEIEGARASLDSAKDNPLLERFELLAAQVLIDRGDCSRAQSELETFLDQHPSSDLRRVARQTLTTLREEGYRCS